MRILLDLDVKLPRRVSKRVKMTTSFSCETQWRAAPSVDKQHCLDPNHQTFLLLADPCAKPKLGKVAFLFRLRALLKLNVPITMKFNLSGQRKLDSRAESVLWEVL